MVSAFFVIYKYTEEPDPFLDPTIYPLEPMHAFLWEDGILTDIGALWGENSRASGINNIGQIVGYSAHANNTGPAATLWDNGFMYNLNDLIPDNSGWTLSFANDINDLGQIVGQGHYMGGQSRGFILTPTNTPEPATILLLSLGGLFLRRHR